MNKQVIRLNESQLTKIIKESVKKVLNERSIDDAYKLGYLSLSGDNPWKKHVDREFNRDALNHPTPYDGNQLQFKNHILNSHALFCVKKCEKELGVRLPETIVSTLGGEPYMFRGVTYKLPPQYAIEKGIQKNLSDEIDKRLRPEGFWRIQDYYVDDKGDARVDWAYIRMKPIKNGVTAYYNEGY